VPSWSTILSQSSTAATRPRTAAYAWAPEEIGHELWLVYIDAPACLGLGRWVDYYGNLVLTGHDDFPRDYAENLLAFLRGRYGDLYRGARGRSIEEAGLVRLLKKRWEFE
jgi:hypothetical protein